MKQLIWKYNERPCPYKSRVSFKAIVKKSRFMNAEKLPNLNQTSKSLEYFQNLNRHNCTKKNFTIMEISS